MTDQTVVIDTPDGMAFFHMCQLRACLKLQADHGLRHSRGSLIKLVNREYGTNFRTAKQALAFMEENIALVNDARGRQLQNEAVLQA